MSPGLTPLRAEIAAWLLACGGLAAGIGVETDWGRRWHPPATLSPPAAADFAKPQLTAPYWLPPADQYLEIAMRPIFVVSRRPAPPTPPPEPPKPTMKKDQFVLTGVTLLPEGKFAFLLDKNEKKTKVVPLGREINGIKIVDIAPDRVVLSQYGEQETLILKTARASALPSAESVISRPGQPAAAQPMPGAPVMPILQLPTAGAIPPSSGTTPTLPSAPRPATAGPVIGGTAPPAPPQVPKQ